MLSLLLVLTSSLCSPALAQENPRIQALMNDLGRREDRFTVGMDMIVVGLIERDRALGYPRSAWGMSPLFGITWRDYDGQPSHREIRQAAKVVNRDYGLLEERDWRRRVKAEVNKYVFSYLGVATSYFFLPGIDAGVMWDFADHEGVGPSVSIGISWGLNTFLRPFPYIAASYSF